MASSFLTSIPPTTWIFLHLLERAMEVIVPLLFVDLCLLMHVLYTMDDIHYNKATTNSRGY